ncbi:hypothetical protein FEM48_Zijuj03G0131200 [Ziziphus jujuba var. spinosa]|uniref:Queuosine 5'-phosphate N-glycosylase/hydrolase n=1 Tax=Ziziphus jujuba var. spinosa TaxID=714518 RepID=A0A978VQH1_ZIZJJ|nr:hypothetical protein FEM48_Zijuj03G0131200 [Ziziphus jujuba var. spinosa]
MLAAPEAYFHNYIIKDTLTATSGAVVPFLSFILHDGGTRNLVLVFAYCGMVVAAHWISKLNTPFLLKALNDYPDYKVKGQGYGEFNDIRSITVMVDYIVPAVLQQLDVLKYSSKLAKLIVANKEIDSGSEEEVKLWTCSIYAVERIKELISKKSGKQMLLNSFDISSNLVLSVELDLWLWSFGIQFPSLQHHRTLSTYH